MRLISQEGNIDVPYEISALSLGNVGNTYTIYVRSKLLDDKPCVIAKYTTEAKAIKAMEMVRDAYVGKDCGYRIENNTIYRSRNEYEAKVFKFPADDEIEV